MAVKSLYRPIEDPAAELAAVKENLRKRQSPIATMTILAGITFIFLIIVHVVEVINMNLCQYAFYFLIFFLAVACTIYLVILMIPLKDKTASLVLLYVLSFCFAVSYVMTAATYHVGVSILSYLLTIFYVVCVIFVANTIA
ncbi:uncharacterized protein, partial [Halyomorpha halys]|uniref:uncharacterized protein n=1 Tax=Halyomorpha halys TaxID=286706 RepID=UPI0006D5105D